jgi:DNA-binding response OmpR family regulator
MTCARCEELEEQVAYLKSELGLSNDVETSDRLRRAMRGTYRPTHASGACGLVLALYAAKGRLRAKWSLMEAIPPRNGGDDDRNPKIIDVYVSCARKGLGHDAIETVWGRGYRMTDVGMERVRAILNPPADVGQVAA